MKTIDTYINEKLNLSKYTCKPKDFDELFKIVKKRLDKDKDADLNDIDISSVTNMSYLFYDLDPHNIDINNWNVSNVISMYRMFYHCKNFNADLSEWDVSNVEDIGEMFSGCTKFNCDLNNWDISKITYMHNMFDGCDSLKNKPSWYKE